MRVGKEVWERGLERLTIIDAARLKMTGWGLRLRKLLEGFKVRLGVRLVLGKGLKG